MSGKRGLAAVKAMASRWRRVVLRAARKATGRGGAPVPVAAGAPRLRIVKSIGVEQLIWLDNAYGLESDGNLTWRWTGPGSSFSLVAQVDRAAPLKIILEVQDSTTDTNWHNTFVECDGVMSLCEHRAQNGRHFLEGKLAPRPGANCATISFHLQECRRPAGGQDGRPLGLRVGALHFAQA